MSLQGKKIVILGGTSGIGLATAKAAAEEGAEIIIVSSRQNSINRAISALPKETRGFAVDLSREGDIRSFFEKADAFDHLVYTAADPLKLGNLSETPIEQLKSMFQVRLWGAFAAVKYGTPLIKKGGSIVLTTGIAAMRPRAGWTAASAICGAMISFTRALAIELAPIRVNAVSPGVVRTPLWNSMSDEDREAFYCNVGAAIPAGRVGEPEDIAQTYLYLMQNGWSTGQTIVIDGGAVLS